MVNKKKGLTNFYFVNSPVHGQWCTFEMKLAINLFSFFSYKLSFLMFAITDYLWSLNFPKYINDKNSPPHVHMEKGQYTTFKTLKSAKSWLFIVESRVCLSNVRSRVYCSLVRTFHRIQKTACSVQSPHYKNIGKSRLFFLQ